MFKIKFILKYNVAFILKYIYIYIFYIYNIYNNNNNNNIYEIYIINKIYNEHIIYKETKSFIILTFYSKEYIKICFFFFTSKAYKK